MPRCLPLLSHSPRGFTLVEMAVVMAVMAILLAAAVPSYSRFLVRKQMELAGESLVLDLRLAREESVRHGQNTFVSYRSGEHWCWGISRGQPCDCAFASSAGQRCNVARADSAEFPRVRMDRADGVEFEHTMGRALAPGSVLFSGGPEQKLRVEVNSLGRASMCRGEAC